VYGLKIFIQRPKSLINILTQMKTLRIFFSATFVVSLFFSCGSSAIILPPIETIDNTPIKTADLTDTEKHNWGHLDLIKDTIPGMSVDKAYSDIIKDKKGKTVIVAVIDTGIDIDHEDLKDVIWINTGEIANNGKDDDKNGYVDDVYGWNFLGDGYNEQFEYVRLLASGDSINPEYNRAEKEYTEQRLKYSTLQKQYLEDKTTLEQYKNNYEQNKTNYEQFLQQLISADEAISKYLNKKDYTKENVEAITTTEQYLQQSIAILKYTYSIGFDTVMASKNEINEGLKQLNEGLEQLNKDLKQLNEGLEQFNDRLNYNLNKDFKGRVNGDNPDDMTTKYYGNNNVKPSKKRESHGTHVAGIIAATRNNGIGMNGVANNVKIMPVRTVPNGDEYDKDVALAIRYAVDNGAKIINGSFGKYYATHSDWVRDAIAYAGKHDVLMVISAGNESVNLDKKASYPNDQVDNGPEISDTYMTIGALTPKYGSEMVAGYSNYGKFSVDVFSPGSDIYSTTPENEYDSKSGTSMAAPDVTGVAALIRSYYPKLTAAQVKQVLMNSGLPVKTNVIVGGNADDIKPFMDLSKSGKIVNAYNALIMASQMVAK
tara:strand:- start:11843 stop:13639 length:1797 start_codon:yes stop_codon:yes gene_type:complete